MSCYPDNLLAQIERDFRFLTDDHAFVAMPPQRSGEVTNVRYEHPYLVIQFTVRQGEWQALVWPAAPQMQGWQVALDDVATYLTRPTVDFAADQARPGLSQSEALRDLAGRLTPIAGEILALFDPARWPVAWADMQAVVQARRAERSRQFDEWWHSRPAGLGSTKT